MNDELTVGDVARIAHTTVRALHHYDEIGLLVPSRTEGGYRVYSGADLARLHDVLLFRELGIPLSQVADLLRADPSHHLAILRSHRERYAGEVRRSQQALVAIDRQIRRMEDSTMQTDEMFDGFEHFDQSEHEGEASERWGDTPAFAESARRTGSYGPEDWKRIKGEGAEHLKTLSALMREGCTPDAPESLELAEAMRRHIDRWFYPCSREMHVNLADMYVADPRFRRTYDAAGEGAAAFIAKAIRENAKRNGAD